jgi:PAS domain S-box-containing protein
MAHMDRLFAEANALIAGLRERIYEIEEARSVHEVEAATSLRLFEYLVAVLVLLLVAGATVYGRLLAGQASREAGLRERHLHAVRQAEARTRAIFDAVPDGVLILDRDGRVESANPAAPRLFGYAAEELLGRDLGALAVEVAGTGTGESSATGLAGWTGRPESELRGRRKDGSTFPLEWNAAPVRLDRADMLAVVVRDISARRHAEEDHRRLQARLHYAQQMEVVAGLSGGIAHYFNTLLMTISSGTALARHELPPDAPARHTLFQVEEAALRGAEVTRQLLAYTGQAELTMARVDLGHLVRDLAASLKGSARAGIAVEVVPAADPYPVQVDPTQVQRVLLNLFANAVEALGPQGGQVTVRTGQMFASQDYLREPHLPGDLPAGDYAYVEVRDDGTGMDTRTRRQMFHPFFSTKFLGRGLGLALVLGIVRAHRGAIKVASEPGSGTTVRVLFPQPQASVSGSEMAEVVRLRPPQRAGLGTQRRTSRPRSA